MNVEFDSSVVAADLTLAKSQIASALKRLGKAYLAAGRPQHSLSVKEVETLATRSAVKFDRRLRKRKAFRYHAETDAFVVHGFFRRRYRWPKIQYVTHSGRIAAFAMDGRVKVCLLESDEKAREFCHVFAIQGVQTVSALGEN